jgi:hypothetical protein
MDDAEVARGLHRLGNLARNRQGLGQLDGAARH